MKRYIRKWLIKNCTHHFYTEHYYFLRWLVSMGSDKKRTKEVCWGVARWMVNNDMSFLPFMDMFVLDGVLYIYTERPGLWIGKGGKTIDNLQQTLSSCISEVRLLEVIDKPYSYVKKEIIRYANDY